MKTKIIKLLLIIFIGSCSTELFAQNYEVEVTAYRHTGTYSIIRIDEKGKAGKIGKPATIDVLKLSLKIDGIESAVSFPITVEGINGVENHFQCENGKNFYIEDKIAYPFLQDTSSLNYKCLGEAVDAYTLEESDDKAWEIWVLYTAGHKCQAENESLNFLESESLIGMNGVDINDVNYKFKFSLPSDWSQRKIEETNKKDAISYLFGNGKKTIMLLSFKVDEVKNLSDFVYTLEKDLTLNIPKRYGDYSDFDSGNYDGKWAKYTGSEFSEIIYYFRTKITDGQNLTYMLRFIIPRGYYNSAVKNDIKKLAGNFSLSLE